MNINFRQLAGLNPEQPYTFEFPIYFSEAEFEGQVDFSQCTFNSTFNLSGATFKGDVLFRQTQFNGKFYPRNTKFYGNVNFRWAKFVNADFHDTVFKDKANFHDSNFIAEKGGVTRFLDVKFQDMANFKNTTFSGLTLFLGTNFLQAKFSENTKFDGITKFRYVVFENGEKTSFDSRYLGNVSFKNTDITRIQFNESVQWGDNNKRGEKLNKYIVWDERQLKESLAQDPRSNPPSEEGDERQLEESLAQDPDKRKKSQEGILESIKAIYRNLRENCEYWLRYDDASEFFIREMELKRRYREVPSNHKRGNKSLPPKIEYKIKQNKWVIRHFSLTGLYCHLFGYGENTRRIALTVIGFYLLTIFYWIITDIPNLYTSHNTQLLVDSLLNASDRSLSDMFQIRGENLVPMDYFIRISSLALLGMVIIALKRRFERKIRH
jgi:uncharacterized protein YjbI with pentapeptide repeats